NSLGDSLTSCYKSLLPWRFEKNVFWVFNTLFLSHHIYLLKHNFFKFYSLPFSNAFLGQTDTHKKHPLQRFESIQTFLFSVSLIAFGSGQVRMHILHPIHFSSSTFTEKYIFFCPLK